MSIRLNKFIAHSAGLSRREADNAIEQGRVTINGSRAQLGAQINASDTIKLDARVLEPPQDYTYLILHKPTGYICSRRQQGTHPTIYSLLPEQYRSLKPVGRLDQDSSGIIILTDDGDFAHQMTHPSFQKTKIYHVALNHDLAPLHHQMINDHGVTLDDGLSRMTVSRLEEKNQKKWQVTMHEGRNRQIRRTFAALGYTVTALHRIQFGPYPLNGLPPSKFRSFSN